MILCRNLSLVKIWKQRKWKIHTLQIGLRRLKNKIISMHQLIDYLKGKSLISKSSELTIKVYTNTYTKSKNGG